jgi:TonB family protein
LIIVSSILIITGRKSSPEQIAAYPHTEPVNRAEVKRADEHKKSEQISALPPAMAKTKGSSAYKAQGKIISSEDNLPVAGVSIVVKGEQAGVMTDSSGSFNIDLPDSKSYKLVASFIGMETKEFESKPDTPAVVKLDPSLTALNEIVVTAYGISREESKMQAKEEEYATPQPVGGKSNFDKYIRENLQWPDTTYRDEKVVVVLSFSVLSDGRIDSIKIIRSPGIAFSDEAIRLLRSGPVWKPAEENGKPVEDQVRVRIVFK